MNLLLKPLATAREIRARRPPKARIDPHHPIDVLIETERQPNGEALESLTVFLAGSECPFTCVFCDLWQHTLDEPTPREALPEQLRQALANTGFEPRGRQVKLYNASNFFEARAVPESDDEAIAALAKRCASVVVECHPRLIGERCLRFAERLDGRLQVAMGLETVHPEIQPRLGKGADLDDFARAAETLGRHGIGWRAFVLVGLPFLHRDEAAHWAIESTRWAIGHGAEHVALIPLRGETLQRTLGPESFSPPVLKDLEEALDRSLETVGKQRASTVITADLWDIDALARCPHCAADRRARLERLHQTGILEPRAVCTVCSAPSCTPY